MNWKGLIAFVACGFAAICFGQELPPIQNSLKNRFPSRMNEIVPGKLLVKFLPAEADRISKSPRAMPSVLLQYGAQYRSRVRSTNWEVFDLPAIANPWEVARSLRGVAGILFAQPLNVVYPLGISVPNDPDYSLQEDDPNLILGLEGEGDTFRRLWHLDDTNTESAWSVYPNQWYTQDDKPRNAPLIAFIDSGCDMGHPDFMNAHEGETGNVDSDQGGQLALGLSKFFQEGEVQVGGSTQDNVGHGTHVTGIALASGNNGSFSHDSYNRPTGTIGIGYNSRGMILRVFADDGTGNDLDAAAAIMFAADNNADIINLSLGTTNYSQLFQDAVTYAFQKGTLVICAGNESSDGGGNLGPIYPAACSGALGVSANGPDLQPATTNYAGTGYYVDVAAPGGDVYLAPDLSSYKIQEIWSTATRTDCLLSENPVLYPPYTLNYTYLLGTSMACPMVSGAAGLYYGFHRLHQKDGYVNVRAYRAIEKGAFGLFGVPGGGWETTQGYGCLDVYSTLVDDDARGATKGGIEGIVYYNGTIVNGVQVTAQKTSGGTICQTTTHVDGTYRFDGSIPAGIYVVRAQPFGALKARKALVKPGCDITGVDLWAGTITGDTTPPVVPKFTTASAPTANSVTLKHFGYDTETGIDEVLIRIGTTPGGQDILHEKDIVPDRNTYTISGLSLVPNQTYYLQGTYTNGAGLSTVKAKSFQLTVGSNDASFGSQSVPVNMVVGQKYTLTESFTNIGTSTWTAGGGYKLGAQNPAGNATWGRSTVSLAGSDSIAPGGSKNFSFTVTAPPEAGDYDCQWAMKQGSSTFGALSPNVIVHVSTVPDYAAFVSQDVPDTVPAGGQFTASVVMKNTGTNVWSDAGDYRLASYNPPNNTTWGPNRVFLGSDTVAPGDTYGFSRTFFAPSTPGTYAFQWKMLKNGLGTFGQASPTVMIVVTP